MSRPDGSLPDMGRHPEGPDRRDPLALDDGTADRLLRGAVAVDDAPRRYQGVAALIAALTAPPSPIELSGERETVGTLSGRIAATASPPPAPTGARPRRKRRIRVAGVALVGSATLLTGLSAAGALPGAAQGIASDVLGTVGVSVPNSHSDGHPDQRGRSGDAVTTAHTAHTGTSTAGTAGTAGTGGAKGTAGTADTGGAPDTNTGSDVSGVAQDPSTTGVDKGAAVSSVASDEQSRAGEVTPPVGPPADPGAAPPAANPEPVGGGTPDDAGGARPGTGPGNSDDAPGHQP